MNKISAEEFDELFDNGESIEEYADFTTACRPNIERKLKEHSSCEAFEEVEKRKIELIHE